MQLALGTVQFGLAYGIAGRGEPVPAAEARAILEDAAARGVRVLDTAAGYGDIESRLGALVAGLPFEVVSKIPAIPAELDPAAAARFALDSARRSRERLGDALRGLMVHRGADLLGDRGDAVWAALQDWARADGTRLGASCYAPDECVAIAGTHAIAIAQLPGNALDQRLAADGTADALRGVEIHLRSAFLQGLLLMPHAEATARLPAAAPALAAWQAHCAALGIDPLAAALGVVRSFEPVSLVVVGVDRLAQWQEIAGAWERARPTLAPELACALPDVIDPRLWKPVP